MNHARRGAKNSELYVAHALSKIFHLVLFFYCWESHYLPREIIARNYTPIILLCFLVQFSFILLAG